MRDLRILCLHGYHGSAAVLRRQMGPLAGTLPPSVEFVHVDAPSLSSGDFGWWHEGFSGWERTCDWAVDLLRTGPRFDGVFGFSQGAALTGLLAAVRESGTGSLLFDIDFVIMVGGFTSTMPQHAHCSGTSSPSRPSTSSGALTRSCRAETRCRSPTGSPIR
jgi:hypothetical protein